METPGALRVQLPPPRPPFGGNSDWDESEGKDEGANLRGMSDAGCLGEKRVGIALRQELERTPADLRTHEYELGVQLPELDLLDHGVGGDGAHPALAAIGEGPS